MDISRRRPLWFCITLRDCGGQQLAQWTYDEMNPVIAPQFTYPNESEQAPFVIRFDHLGSEESSLPAHIDLNYAIYNAVQRFAGKIRDKS